MVHLYPIKTMTTPLSFFAELQTRINEVLQQSPAKDLEKNMKAMLNQGFSRLDLLTREEFEVQAEVLARTRARLEALEARVAELESRHTS
jgi:BMFP domain-containing protein YqiC